jgi:tetratricopeptide (TPR) repeat protein
MRPIVLALVLVAAPLAAQQSLVEQGQAAIDRNDPQGALPVLQRAAAEDPNSAKVHYLLGVAYGNLAQKASAFHRMSLARHTRDEFERSVALDPNDLDARWALVQYYALAPGYLGGNEEKARQQAEEISKRDASFGKRAFDFLARKRQRSSSAQSDH